MPSRVSSKAAPAVVVMTCVSLPGRRQAPRQPPDDRLRPASAFWRNPVVEEEDLHLIISWSVVLWARQLRDSTRLSCVYIGETHERTSVTNPKVEKHVERHYKTPTAKRANWWRTGRPAPPLTGWIPGSAFFLTGGRYRHDPPSGERYEVSAFDMDHLTGHAWAALSAAPLPAALSPKSSASFRWWAGRSKARPWPPKPR